MLEGQLWNICRKKGIQYSQETIDSESIFRSVGGEVKCVLEVLRLADRLELRGNSVKTMRCETANAIRRFLHGIMTRGRSSADALT